MKKMIFVMAALAMMTTAGAQDNTQRPGKEERARKGAERMQKEYGLSDEQRTKVYEARLEMRQKSETLRAQQREAAKAQHQALYEEHSKTMRSILNDEQYAKWEKEQQERKAKMTEGRDHKGKHGKYGKHGKHGKHEKHGKKGERAPQKEAPQE